MIEKIAEKVEQRVKEISHDPGRFKEIFKKIDEDIAEIKENKFMADDYTKENWDKIKKNEPIHREYISEEMEANGYGRTRYQDLHRGDDPNFTRNPLE